MLNAGTRAGLCCSHLLHLLALILGCGVGVHNTAQEGVVVVSSAWPRLTPVSLAQSKQRSLQAAGGQWAFGTPTAATSSVEHTFPTMHAPQAGRWKEKMLEWMLKGCLFLYFFFFFEGWDSLTGVYFQHGFSVKQVQPVCKLHCSLGWEQGEYLPHRDFVVNFVAAVLERKPEGFFPLFSVNKVFFFP